MRASRLVSLLLMLQTRDRMTAEELAEALEVSVRTIYRDVESLSAAGVPIYGEAGHEGGYRLVGGYRTRLTGLSEDEAEALFLTGLPAAAAQLGLAGATSSARLKLSAALPETLRARADRIAGRFYFDVPPWYDDTEREPCLAALADATWNQRVVRLRYLRWAKPHEVTRTVEPYGLVLKAGNWYLVGRHRSQFKSYRVSRVIQAEVGQKTFEREEFDLAEYWQASLENFDRRRLTTRAVLRLTPEGVLRLPQVLEPVAVEAARASAVGPDPEGWTEVSIPVESPEASVLELIRLGADAEVKEPEELRQAMIRELQRMTERYQERK
ncbi:helix-turn-helix transcriptional regulator [Kineosporia babensis]|uniref:YafY family transcriptional regulator n=1 Tax=Kineosporia babensis TaxID=499548 RepID=A0A9X1SRM5_9ACTN|nr:YafY family protein [Kineosporia babensis]MCD5309341.1 YafY family transcriptional regulator [Kineosporia babensis]